ADSPTVKAVRLFQALMKFHQRDTDPTAFLGADLDRLVFGFNKAFGAEKNPRYKDSLERFANAHSGHEIFAHARYHEAVVLEQENHLLEAHRLASQGAKAFPESIGGREGYNLVQGIEATSSTITNERVWN